TVAVTSNSLLLVFLNIENPSQKPDVYGGRLGPERGRPAAGRPSLTDTRLPQPVEERDAVGLRIGVRRWGEGEAPEGQREPLEVAADRLGQVAVDAQNGVDALAWRGPIRDEAHVERDDPRGRLVLVLRRAGPVADPVDKACPREVTSLQWLPADEAGDDVGALREQGAVRLLVHEGPATCCLLLARLKLTRSRQRDRVLRRRVGRDVRPARHGDALHGMEQVPPDERVVMTTTFPALVVRRP